MLAFGRLLGLLASLVFVLGSCWRTSRVLVSGDWSLGEVWRSRGCDDGVDLVEDEGEE